jgi:hypothetical protein
MIGSVSTLQGVRRRDQDFPHNSLDRIPTLQRPAKRLRLRSSSTALAGKTNLAPTPLTRLTTNDVVRPLIALCK